MGIQLVFGNKVARPLQADVVDLTVAALAEGHRRILVLMPTGSGKTMTGGLLAIDQRIRAHVGVPDGEPLRLWFLCHRQRLLAQARAAYAEHPDIELTVISTAGDIPSGQPHLILYDEAHHEATMSVQRRLEEITVAPLIGLSANDVDGRGDSRLCKFSKVIQPLSRQQAVDAGYLAKSHIHSFIDCRRNLCEIGVDAIALKGKDMDQTMVFTRTREEAAWMTAKIRELGFTAETLTDITEKALDEQLQRFAAAEYQFAVSCMKLGEGIDVKGCRSVMILRRLKKSRGLLNQFIGRAARPDCPCDIYEVCDPLSDNLSATAVVGQPAEHIVYYRVRGEWRTHVLTAEAA